MAAQGETYKPFEKVTPEELQKPTDAQTQPSQATEQSSQKRGLPPNFSVFVIVLATVALFLGGYFYLQYQQNENLKDKQKIEEEEKRKEEQRLQQIKDNARYDQTRKLDISSLKTGLDKYFVAKKEYPEKMEKLTPDYLRIIPLDPVTKEPYAYEPSEDLSTYKLSATLSDGSSYTVQTKEE